MRGCVRLQIPRTAVLEKISSAPTIMEINGFNINLCTWGGSS